MEGPDPYEPDTHVFTGTLIAWGGGYGELLTDSGVTVPLIAEGPPPVANGVRVTIVSRKLRPRFKIDRMTRAD